MTRFIKHHRAQAAHLESPTLRRRASRAAGASSGSGVSQGTARGLRAVADGAAVRVGGVYEVFIR